MRAGSGEVTADGPVVVDGLRMEGSARLQLAGQDLVGTVGVCGTASVELRDSSRVAAGASAVFNSAGCPAGASGRLLVTDGANLSVDGVLDVAGIAFTNDGVMSGSGVLAGRYGGAGDVVPDAPAFTIDGDHVKLQSVDLGQRNDVDAQVVKGLSDGQTIVLHPPDTLTDGARIRVRQVR